MNRTTQRAALSRNSASPNTHALSSRLPRLGQRIRLAGFALLLLSLSPPSFARDLAGRFGLGYNAEFANVSQTNGVPAISIKYGLTRDIGVEGVVSIATTTPSNSGTGLKLFKNIFFEPNLNFYFMLGGAILNANQKSGSQFIAGFGVEFFIPGVDSLGLAMETGGSFDNLSSDSYVFRTLGVSFLNAGMHFYF